VGRPAARRSRRRGRGGRSGAATGVADELVLVQCAPILVAGCDQHREHVRAIAAPAPIPQDGGRLIVDRPREVQEAPVRQRGCVGVDEHARRDHRQQPALHHARELRPAGPLVPAEERLGRDAERELRHVGVDVARLAGAIVGERLVGDAHHVVAVGVDARLGEGRHEQAPVLAVLAAVDVEQTGHRPRDGLLARRWRTTRREEAAGQRDHVVALVIGEHLAIELGPVDADDAGAACAFERGYGGGRPGVHDAQRSAHDRRHVAVALEQAPRIPDGVGHPSDRIPAHAEPPHRSRAGCGGDRDVDHVAVHPTPKATRAGASRAGASSCSGF
jgi:hypothetical protein